MDMNSLRYFCAFYRCGNISQAAKELYITQQGLSRAIRGLSCELGSPLTERRGTAVVPTPYGERFYEFARDILNQYDSLLKNFSELGQATEGTVELGFALGVSSFLGFDMLKDFEQAFPNISVQKQEDEDLTIEEKVLNGELDLGLTIHSVDENIFDSFLLKMSRYYLLCHRDHPLAKKETIRFSDLKDQPVITLTDKCKGTTRLKERCRQHGFELNQVATSKEMIVIWELALDNRGVVVTSSGRLLYSKFNPGNKLPLVEIPLDDDENYFFKVYLIARRGQPLSYPAYLLKECLLSRFPTADVKLTTDNETSSPDKPMDSISISTHPAFAHQEGIAGMGTLTPSPKEEARGIDDKQVPVDTYCCAAL
jgi:DNA-binding transcriptional LysR family regulator